MNEDLFHQQHRSFFYKGNKTSFYVMSRRVLFSMIVMILCVLCAISQAENIITVDQSGNGNYNKIQDAIDSIPSNNKEPVTISIKPGIYKETIYLPPEKPFITLSGYSTKADDVVIKWNQKGGIYEVATLQALASDFTARYITIQNAYVGSQAVALRVSGDRVSFYNCSIIGYQDTLFDDWGRHYYENCYIEGVVDFIFGSATSFYQDCHIHSSKGGYITAQRRVAAADPGGFVFFRGWITGKEKTHLGRPWEGSYARVIFAYTYMEDVIEPLGWDDWNESEGILMKNSFCGQFKCEGPGATTSQRLKWAREFNEEEVKPFLTRDFINGKDWLKLSPPVPSLPPSAPPPVIPPPVMPSLPPPAPVIPESPPAPVVIPSSPPAAPQILPPLPPSVTNPSSPPPAAVVPPPRPLMSSPPPPSTMPVIITPWLTPQRPMGRAEEGEPFMIYYSSGASSLFKNCFSGIATLALSSAVLLYLLA